MREIGRAFGLDRLLWASDWPWIQEVPGYSTLLSLVDHFFPEATADERAAVMGDNGARVLRLGDGADMPVPAEHIAALPRSGIREIMDLSWELDDVIHLEVDEPEKWAEPIDEAEPCASISCEAPGGGTSPTRSHG